MQWTTTFLRFLVLIALVAGLMSPLAGSIAAQDASVEDVPAEEVPVDEVPVEEIPVEETPVEEVVTEVPTEAALEEPPVETEADTGNLMLLVQDSVGNPVDGGCFVIDGDASLTVCTGSSGTSGAAGIESLAVGDHQIEMTDVPTGYALAESQIVAIEAGSTSDVLFILDPLEATVEEVPPTQPADAESDGNTPVGNAVAVSPSGLSNVVITYDAVSQSGETSVSNLVDAPAFPRGFLLVGGTYFDVSTTAEFSGAQVCLPFDPMAVSDPNSVRLMHYENGAWVDVTTGSPDVANGLVCGWVTSFSPFGAAIADTTDPEVAFISPVDGATVSDLLTLTADASDETGIAEVRFKYTSTPDDSDSWTSITDADGTDGWTATVDTTQLPEGAYTLRAVAEDMSGNTRTAQIVVTFEQFAQSLAEEDASLTVHRIDDGDADLPGGAFVLYTDAGDGTRGNLITDANVCCGDAVFDDQDGSLDSYSTSFRSFEPGSYILVDAFAPEGYARAADQQITLVAGSNEFTVSNRLGGTIEITRLDSATDLAVPGGCFGVWTDAGGGTRGEYVKGCLAYPSGNLVTLTGLAAGAYLLEDEAPAGYLTLPDQPFSIDFGQTLPLTVWSSQGASLAIHLTDENGVDLLGGGFVLFTDAGDGTRGEEVAASTCCNTWLGDANDGELDGWTRGIKLLAPGDYVIAQGEVPSGYAFAPDLPITLIVGSNEATVVNRIGGVIEITRLDAANGDPLPGGCYAVWTDAGDGTRGHQIQGCPAAPVGNVLTMAGLPAGDYLLLDGPPDGYQAAVDQPFSIDFGQTLPLTVQNVQGATLAIHLTDENGDDLPGGGFVLFTDAGDGTRGSEVEASTCCGSWLGDGNDGEFDGWTRGIALLEPGDYVIANLEMPSGYALASDYPVTLQAGNNDVIVVGYLGGTIDVSRFYTDGSPLVGGGYGIFRDAGDGVRGDQVTSFWAADGESVASVSGIASGNYLLVDFAPEGYLSASDQSFMIDYGQTVTLTVDNALGAVLVIHRTDADGNDLPGGAFELYTDAGDGTRGEIIEASLCCGTWLADENDGDADSWTTGLVALAPGSYILVDAWTPPGFASAPDQLIELDESGYEATVANEIFVNQEPVANQDEVTTEVDQPITIHVLSNDTDVDGPAPLTIALDGSGYLPGYGTVAIAEDDPTAIVYTPNPGVIGIDFFSYTLSDGADTVQGNVSVTVIGPLTLEIQSLDQDNGPAPRACFILYMTTPEGEQGRYAGQGCDYEQDADGVVQITGLVSGLYLLQEQSPPNGFDYVVDRLVTVGPDDVTRIQVAHTLAAGTGALRVHAVDGDISLVGACWELYPGTDRDSATWIIPLCDSHDSINDGWSTMYHLQPGIYSLWEQRAPSGYYAVETSSFTIVEGEVLELSLEHDAGSALTVSTVREDGSSVMGGCAYVRTDIGDDQWGAYVTATCDDDSQDGALDGLIVTPGLLPGNYRVEISSSGSVNDYPLIREHQFSVTADGTVVTADGGSTLVVVIATGATAIANFVDANGQPLGESICVNLFHDAGGQERGAAVYGDGASFCPGVSWPGDDGPPVMEPAYFVALGPGDYLLALVPPTGGYALSPDYGFTVAAGETNEFTVTLGVQEPGAALVFDVKAVDGRYRPITTARLGQTIQFSYSFGNSGTEDLTTIRIQNDHSGEIWSSDFWGRDWGATYFQQPYTVTAADAARGTISLTATVTTDQLGPVTKTLTILVQAEPNTPATSDVPLSPAGVEGATLTFSDISVGGYTAVTPLADAPDLPAGFNLEGAVFYEIDTTAVFDGPVLVCIPYDEGTLDNPRLLHYENDAWLDITSESDSSAGLVCGWTSSFSPFALAQLSDTVPPVLTVPAPITVEATSPAGANVAWSGPTATDAIDPNPTIGCTVAGQPVQSGASFPIGTTTVTCTAEDSAGNSASAAFTIKVQTTLTPTTKDQCKKDGWKTFNKPFFKHQGDCASYASTRK